MITSYLRAVCGACLTERKRFMRRGGDSVGLKSKEARMVFDHEGGAAAAASASSGSGGNGYGKTLIEAISEEVNGAVRAERAEKERIDEEWEGEGEREREGFDDEEEAENVNVVEDCSSRSSLATAFDLLGAIVLSVLNLDNGVGDKDDKDDKDEDEDFDVKRIFDGILRTEEGERRRMRRWGERRRGGGGGEGEGEVKARGGWSLRRLGARKRTKTKTRRTTTIRSWSSGSSARDGRSRAIFF